MIRIVLLQPAISCLSYAMCFAQFSVVNNGLPISNKDIDVIIRGNVIHRNEGSINNTGHFYITGDWTNNNSSAIIFAAGQPGWVHLTGGTQTINGTKSTYFNKLETSGTGIKQLSGVDATVEDTLALNDLEFSTGNNTLSVTGTGTGLITRTSGFVSSTGDGWLARNTNASSTYIFPVGSNAPALRYRPVDITPSSASQNTFKVRMANADATTEGYDRSVKDGILGEINPIFYHRIARTDGSSPSDITLYFDKSTDGEYVSMTKWKSSLKWQNITDINLINNYSMSGLKKIAWDDFSPVPFAIAKEVEGQSVFVPNMFTPNADGKNDILRVRGRGIDYIHIMIFDRWGEKVYESNDVSTGWDGNYNGAPMNSGVFVYVLKGKYKNGNTIDEKGNTTLLR